MCPKQRKVTVSELSVKKAYLFKITHNYQTFRAFAPLESFSGRRGTDSEAIYGGESNENLKIAIKIRNTVRLSVN